MIDYAEKYEKQSSFEKVLRIQRRKQVLKTLRDRKAKHILEIGCGMDPIFTSYHDYEKCVIIEPDQKFADNAKCLFWKFGEHKAIEVIKAKFEEVWKSVKDFQFDMIIISSLLHEVPSSLEFLQNVRELCDNDTRVHINVPNSESFHRLLGLASGITNDLREDSEDDKSFNRQFHFDIASLLDLVKKAGMRAVLWETYFVKPFSNLQMKQMFDTRIIDSRIISGLEKLIYHLPRYGAEIMVVARRV